MHRSRPRTLCAPSAAVLGGLSIAALCCCVLSFLSANEAAGAGTSDPAPLIYVESQRNRTFGPQRETPAGTVFHIKVVTKADSNALRLHRCGDKCKSAETVKLWQPGDYRV